MKARQVLFFILTSISLLALLGYFFPKDGIKVGSYTLEFIHPSEIIKEDTVSKVDIHNVLDQGNYLNSEEVQSLTDSIRILENFAENSPLRLRLPDDNSQYLFPLFHLMDNSKKNKQTIRIIHYGDSQIEIDRISDIIREELQKKFGGIGPGMIPAIQTIPSRTVSQSYTGNLTRYSVYGSSADRATHRRYGIMAMMSELNGEANINFRTRGEAYSKAKKFSKIHLIIGNNENQFSARLSSGSSDFGVKTVESSKSGITLLTWDLGNAISSANLNILGKADIYGICLDGKWGVAFDNIPMRGCSGTIFTGIAKESMSEAYKQTNTNLIIMQYGGNMMPQISGMNRVEWYGEQMAKQIQYLKEVHPEALFIFIGPSDMSRNIKGNMETWPYLEEVNNQLQKTALDNGIAYWNMFEAMGGKNSMPEWVKSQPALATTDYIHFTPRGANKIGELFVTALMNNYQIYSIIEQYKTSKESKKTKK